MLWIRKQVSNHKLFLLFTLAYFLFSIFTYKDYGVTYDEKVEYDAGKYLLTYYQKPTSLEYVSQLVNEKPAHIKHRHLPLFSVYSRIYPALVNILNPNYYFEWFHLQNLLLGWFAFLFSYVLFFLHYKNGRKAVLAPIFVAFTAYFLGHIPANPKDVPFASCFLLGSLLIYYFRANKPNKINQNLEILVLGLVFGLAISQRAVGLTLFLAYAFFEFLDLPCLDGFSLKKSNRSVHRFFKENTFIKQFFDLLLRLMLIFIVSLLIWAIALPFLGANIPLNFYELLVNASRYADWNREIIYFGEYLKKFERPWHYLFVYLGMKLPLFTLFSLFFGSLLVLFKKLSYKKDHPIVLLSFLVFLNFAIYLLVHPVVYNAIRHFLYLVLLVTLLACFLFLDILSLLSPCFKKWVLVVTVIYFGFTAFRMIHLHPYEYIYFNEVTGGLKNVSGKFDTEYWGAAYKEAAEYVSDFAVFYGNEDLRVYACTQRYVVSYYSDNKYQLVDQPNEADIILCDLHKDTLNNNNVKYPPIYSINREGVPIFIVRKGPR
ncbi:MAG TPA: hypothetical protein PLT50_00715 [bacterium]|nr:hypothetical protein [bacterium]